MENIQNILVGSHIGIFPTVTVSGRKIHVEKYKGKMGKEEFELTDDEEFEAPIREVDTEYLGYIIKDQSGEVRLLVDEVSVNDPPIELKKAGVAVLQFVFGFFAPANSDVFTQGRIKKNKEESHDA